MIAAAPASAQDEPGEVVALQKISSTAGDFAGPLSDFDGFGRLVVALGDLDADGTGDLAVGAIADDDGGPDRGAVWILFLDPAKWLDAGGLVVGPAGSLQLEASWPVGVPDDFTSWMQMWIADASGPAGFTASNGVIAITA